MDPPLDEPPVGGEELLEPVRMMRHPAVQHRLARRPHDRELEIGQERAPPPQCDRAEALPIRGQFGNERVPRAQGPGEVLDERGKEALASCRFDALDDLPERAVLRECLPVLPVAHPEWSAWDTTSRAASSRATERRQPFPAARHRSSPQPASHLDSANGRD